MTVHVARHDYFHHHPFKFLSFFVSTVVFIVILLFAFSMFTLLLLFRI